ncbi:Inosine-uridine preferring nucleoside hydrolase [Entamoeba marina]
MAFPAKPQALRNYVYENRQVPYRSEKLEISQTERLKIKSIAPKPVKSHLGDVVTKPVNLLIDTDIGTDLDDALALLYGLHLPNANIIGLTTNYGPTDIRANDAHKIVDRHFELHPEYPKFPIVAGASRQLGTHRSIFLAGHEGFPFLTLEQSLKFVGEKAFMDHKQNTAAAFIAWAAMQYEDLVILSIGIPTNIALAIETFPEIKGMIKEIVCMGCGSEMVERDSTRIQKQSYNKKDWEKSKPEKPMFGLPNKPENVLEWVQSGKILHLYPNHNLSGDTLASVVMFSSGIPIKIISHSVTSKFWLEGDAIEYLKKQADSVPEEKLKQPDLPSQSVGLLLQYWFGVRFGQNGQCPHDPLALHEAVYGGEDGHVIYVNGTMIIHEWAAFGTFIPHPDGRHKLGVGVYEKDKFLEKLSKTLMTKRITKTRKIKQFFF